MGINTDEPRVTSEDVLTLEGFGYKQELKRGFSFFGMIGFSFSVLTCWTALAGSLTVAISAGGPPVIIYSWIGTPTYSVNRSNEGTQIKG